MKPFLAVLGFLTLASVLAAAAPPVQDVLLGQKARADGLHVGSKNQPVLIDGVLYIDQRKTSTGDLGACDGGPGICFTGKGKGDYDFPSLSGPGTALNTVCAESSAITATGCAFGDTVEIGVDQAVVNAFGTITGYVSAADAVKVRACASGITDGGSFNQPDSGYTVRCFR